MRLLWLSLATLTLSRLQDIGFRERLNSLFSLSYFVVFFVFVATFEFMGLSCNIYPFRWVQCCNMSGLCSIIKWKILFEFQGYILLLIHNFLRYILKEKFENVSGCCIIKFLIHCYDGINLCFVAPAIKE